MLYEYFWNNIAQVNTIYNVALEIPDNIAHNIFPMLNISTSTMHLILKIKINQNQYT